MLTATVDYIFLKYKDVYTLKNTSTTTFNYSISRIVNKVSSIVISGTVLSGATATLSLGNLDGHYKLSISNSTTSAEPIEIKYFPNLLKTIIDKTKEITCKECGTCDKCEDCHLQLSLIIAVLNYAYLHSPTYNGYFEGININLKDTTTNKIVKYLNDNLIFGEGNVTPLFIQTVGTHYLSFYYTEVRSAKDAEEIAYIKAKYNAEEVITCLNSMGIIVPQTETVISASVDVYYWQLVNSTETIDSILNPLTDIYLSNKSKDTLENFSLGKTIGYSNIAKVVFVIKGSVGSNFALYDSLNNNVTTQFDKIYNPVTKTVLYVSKTAYSFSNVFFKIKNLDV